MIWAPLIKRLRRAINGGERGYPCPICDNTRSALFFVKDDRPLRICSTCRHVYWAQSATPEMLADYYRREYTANHGQAQTQKAGIAYYRVHAAELLTVTGRKAATTSIVDVGCSYPCFLQEAKGLGYRQVLGVDWSPEAHEFGREQGIAMATPDEFSRVVADRSVDILRLSHTVEHFIDPCASLAAMLPKLREGGFVYITQPNFPVFRCAWADREIADMNWPSHQHFFNPLSATHMLARLGLRLTRFFSHTNTEECQPRYKPIVDLPYATKKLKTLKDLGDPYFGAANNYPAYFGSNSTIYATTAAAPQAHNSAQPQHLSDSFQLSF